MGYIEGIQDLMEMETGFLGYAMELLKKEYQKELELLQVKLPCVDRIPQVRFEEAKRLVAEKYGRTIRSPFDLEPEEESLIGRYFQRSTGRILCLSQTTRRKNVRFMPWMIRRIPVYAELRSSVPGA